MADMTALATASMAFRRARLVNATSNTTLSKIPTVTAPFTTVRAGEYSFDAGTATGSALIPIGGVGGGAGNNGGMFVPYAIGSNDNTFQMRVYGWRVIQRSGVTDLWVPVKLIEVTCTLSSTVPGIAAAAVLNTELFCDTIALYNTSGNDDVSVDIVSPADNTIGHFVLDLKGSQFIECTFDNTTSTSANCLVALL